MAYPRGKRRRVVPGCDRLEERPVMSGSAAGGFVGELPWSPDKTVSTVAANAGRTPYGVVSVPGGFLVTDVGTSAGAVRGGDTVEKVFLNGKTKTWYTAPKGFALTGAITTLPNGEVILGIEPAFGSGGTSNAQDSLVVLPPPCPSGQTLSRRRRASIQ